MKINFLLLILLLCAITANSQILTKQEMANFDFSSGYTGVGKFPPLALVLPKSSESDTYSILQYKTFLLVKTSEGWQSKEFICLKGIGLSNSGKIWAVSSYILDELCADNYSISYSSDGGLNWEQSFHNYREDPSPITFDDLVGIDLNKYGNGRLLITKNQNGKKSFVSKVTNNIEMGNLEGVSKFPISKSNIVTIFQNEFKIYSLNKTASRWLDLLEKEKGKERKKFPK